MKKFRKLLIPFLLFSVSTTSLPLSPKLDTTEEVKAASYQDVYRFPSSYQYKLLQLKKKHPNWKFERVNVNLSWNTVLKNELSKSVNTIQSDAPKGGNTNQYSAPLSYLSTSKSVYDIYTDKYKVVDSNNLYAVNQDVLAYYMDPRNFLTENQIFQFLSLKYESNQTLDGVKKVLNNTFMSGDYTYKKNAKEKKTDTKKNEKKKKKKTKTVKKNYPKTFLQAGKKYSINPYFLAVRSRQEVGGSVAGTATSGKCPGYSGYYNFFNIGANDTANGSAAKKGLAYAKSSGEYGRPWNNQYKAIMGGANFLASAYISVGQNTFYFQKFSVVNSAYRYWHQYMSCITAISSEASNMHSAYSSMGIINQPITFRIPVYLNMPQSPANLPAKKGCHNNYLKQLTIKIGSKRKTLISKKTLNKKTFSLTVNCDIKKINIGAKSCCKDANISGCRSYALTAGKTKKIRLKVKAENKLYRTYIINVTRLKEDTYEDMQPPIEDDSDENIPTQQPTTTPTTKPTNTPAPTNN